MGRTAIGALMVSLALGALPPSAPAALRASAKACPPAPAKYRTGTADVQKWKTGAWTQYCNIAKAWGPRQTAKLLHLRTTEPRAVATAYADHYLTRVLGKSAVARRLARRIGESTIRNLLRDAWLAGFKARGRP